MKVVLTVISCFLSNFAIAQGWQNIGLQSEYINSIAIDVNDSGVLYVGSDFNSASSGTVFKSTDNGVHWDTLDIQTAVPQVVIDPANSNTIYVNTATKILRTIDGGIHWARADSGISLEPLISISSFVIDPKNPEILFAGTAGNGPGGLYKSINNGQTWSELACLDSTQEDCQKLNGGVISIAIYPKDPQILYVGISWTGEVLKTIDGGITWCRTNLLQNGFKDVLWIHPLNQNHVYAGVRSYGLFKTTDGGESWSKENLPDSVKFIKSIVFEPRDFSTIYLGTEHGVFTKDLVENTWGTINTGLGNLHISNMTISPDGGKLYLGLDSSGGLIGGIYTYSLVTSIDEKSGDPFLNDSILYQSYPNPFNDMTVIAYSLSSPAKVSLTVYDVRGRLVVTLVNEYQTEGFYRIPWHGINADGFSISSGLYVCKLQVNEVTIGRKMLHAK